MSDLLTPRQRQAYALYRLDGLSQTAVAAKLGISRESVNRLIRRARAKLRPIQKRLAAQGREFNEREWMN